MGRDARARGAVAEAPKPAELSEAQLERIAQDTSRMDHRERIAYWDKRQARNWYGEPTYQPGVALCPNDASHGALMINGSGTLLMCGARKGGAWCTGSMPVSL